MDRADPLFNAVLSFVILAHSLLVVLCCLSIFTTPLPDTKRGQKIRVQTINLSPPQATPHLNVIEAKASPSPISPHEVEPVTKEQPVLEPQFEASPKTELKAPPEAQPQSKSQVIPPSNNPPKPQLKPQPKIQPKILPKTSPKPKPPAQPAQNEAKQKNDADRQKLLAKAKESLGQFKTTNPKPAAQLNKITSISSQPLEKLQTEAYISNGSLFNSERDGNYRDELISRLKRSLKLPGYGNVTIELAIERSGKVKSMKILKDENSENRKHIEKIVPTLSFPSFGSSYENETQHTFVITLTNDL